MNTNSHNDQLSTFKDESEPEKIYRKSGEQLFWQSKTKFNLSCSVRPSRSRPFNLAIDKCELPCFDLFITLYEGLVNYFDNDIALINISVLQDKIRHKICKTSIKFSILSRLLFRCHKHILKSSLDLNHKFRFSEGEFQFFTLTDW